MSELKKIKLDKIISFKNHPFQVNNDDSMKDLVESIKTNGLLNPLIVRECGNNQFEMISGHRRKLALEINGIEEADAYIKELTDDEAIIYMVDSNMYREKIFPSEKAYAYKMKLDALKHQGKKMNTSTTKVSKKRTNEIVGDANGVSREQIRKYIRLTFLIPDLLELVDNSVKYDKRTYLTMGIKPAVELSYLNIDEQKLVYASITYLDLTPSHAQTIRIRELSKNKLLNYNSLEEILLENKGNQNDKITFNKEKIEKVLPPELLKRDKRYIEKYIIDAIVQYNSLNNFKNDEINLLDLKV